MNAFVLHILEIIGLVAGLAYVVGASLERIWCWPVSLIFIVTYALITWHEALYGEFGMQFLYAGLTLYGWRAWARGDRRDDLPVSRLPLPVLLGWLSIGTLGTAGLFLLLDALGNSLPFWDALTSSFSLVATVLVARKRIENWVFWVVIDAAYVGIFWWKGYEFYAALYAFYALYSLYGYHRWSTSLRTAHRGERP